MPGFIPFINKFPMAASLVIFHFRFFLTQVVTIDFEMLH